MLKVETKNHGTYCLQPDQIAATLPAPELPSGDGRCTIHLKSGSFFHLSGLSSAELCAVLFRYALNGPEEELYVKTEDGTYPLGLTKTNEPTP